MRCGGCLRALTPFAFGGLVAVLALGTQTRMDHPKPRVSDRTEGEIDRGVDVGLDDRWGKVRALHPVHYWHEDRPTRHRHQERALRARLRACSFLPIAFQFPLRFDKLTVKIEQPL